MPKRNIEDILQAIRMQETSGGKNLNHEPIKSGPFKGMRAGGEYGMIPPTVGELGKRHPELKDQYGDLFNSPHEKVTERLNQEPELAKALAQKEYADLLERFNGNEDAAKYAWFMGRSNALKKLASSPDAIPEHWYVKGVNKYLGEIPEKSFEAPERDYALKGMRDMEQDTQDDEDKKLIAKLLSQR